MKRFCLALAIFLSFFTTSSTYADLPGNWSGAVSIVAINMGGNGEFAIVAPNAPSPGNCNGVYRVYINSAMLVTSTFGLEMLHKHAIAALVSGKRASIFHSNDSACYVGFIQLNAN